MTHELPHAVRLFARTLRALATPARRRFGAAVATVAVTAACGAGVPVQVRIDSELDMRVDVDKSIGELEKQLKASGALPRDIAGIPEVWPDALPQVTQVYTVASPPTPVDLSPTKEEDPEAFKKFEKINKVVDAIDRIELDRLLVRFNRNSTNVALPEMAIQVSSDENADPEDGRSWETIGILPGSPAGTVGDVEFEFVRGGETLFNALLSDEQCSSAANDCKAEMGADAEECKTIAGNCKEFAIRARGTLTFDTAVSPQKPRGKADVRLIVVATFFIKPEAI